MFSYHLGALSGSDAKAATSARGRSIWTSVTTSTEMPSILCSIHGKPGSAPGMATTKQREAAKRNIQKAQATAKRKRTIANLPKSTRRGLQAEARKGAGRAGHAGHALEDRNRRQLYEIAKKEGIPGRSRMGKWELIDAIRKAR
jgi:hypothetical protein